MLALIVVIKENQKTLDCEGGCFSFSTTWAGPSDAVQGAEDVDACNTDL